MMTAFASHPPAAHHCPHSHGHHGIRPQGHRPGQQAFGAPASPLAGPATGPHRMPPANDFCGDLSQTAMMMQQLAQMEQMLEMLERILQSGALGRKVFGPGFQGGGAQPQNGQGGQQLNIAISLSAAFGSGPSPAVNSPLTPGSPRPPVATCPGPATPQPPVKPPVVDHPICPGPATPQPPVKPPVVDHPICPGPATPQPPVQPPVVEHPICPGPATPEVPVEPWISPGGDGGGTGGDGCGSGGSCGAE